MVLRIDKHRGSYRLLFYCPIWMINATDLKFQFKVFQLFLLKIKFKKLNKFRLTMKKHLLMLLINHILFVQKNSKVNHIKKRFFFLFDFQIKN
jgi:hypothetical protein